MRHRSYKTCTKCNQVLEIEQFYSTQRSWCRSCTQADTRARARQNKIVDPPDLQRRQEAFASTLPQSIAEKLAYAKQLVAEARMRDIA